MIINEQATGDSKKEELPFIRKRASVESGSARGSHLFCPGEKEDWKEQQRETTTRKQAVVG